MERADLEGFLGRGWEEAAILKRRYWADLYAEHGPAATFRAAEALRQHLEAVNPDWPTAEERQADLEHHIRLRRLLDETAHAFPRR